MYKNFVYIQHTIYLFIFLYTHIDSYILYYLCIRLPYIYVCIARALTLRLVVNYANNSAGNVSGCERRSISIDLQRVRSRSLVQPEVKHTDTEVCTEGKREREMERQQRETAMSEISSHRGKIENVRHTLNAVNIKRSKAIER